MAATFAVFAEANPYEVGYASPAIPMDAMTYVDLSEMLIKVNGTYILGSSLDLKFENGVSGAEVSNGTIRAYDKGSYKLTATDADGNK